VRKPEIEEFINQLTVHGTDQTLGAVGGLTNLQVFGEELIIDLTLPSPSLQARKKTEAVVVEAIQERFGAQLKIQVNSKLAAPPKVAAPIKGKSIPGIQNIVAVASGKGGVGKSTVTANLAITLAEMGFKVGILDADIYGPSMPMMFDVAYERPLAVTVDGKSKMKPVSNYGIKLLSIGFFTEPDQAVIWRGPMAAKALNQMIFDADWGTLDFLLIDLPPGTGDIHLSIMQSLPITGAAVVSTPQAVALADAKKGVAMFQQDSIQVPVLGIIENMAYFTPEELPDNKYYIFGKGGAKYLATDLEVPFLGALPLVQSVREAGDVGRPAVLQENSPVAEQFVEVTRNLVSELVKRNEELPPTEAIKITTMAGCAAVQKS
jgi:ATP-binding protein involved in chromosome partitioning